jgi:beta-lactamase superfamily II metal-dependent hydrolase
MRSFYWILCVVLVFANVTLYQTVFAPPVLEVRVFEVGKERAALVHTPNGKTLLIDTGSDASILRVLGSQLPMWQRSLDALILTSREHNTTGGLPEVTERYRIKNLISSLTRNERLLLGDSSYIDVLSLPKKKVSPLILRLSYGSTTITISSSTPSGVYTSDGKTVK